MNRKPWAQAIYAPAETEEPERFYWPQVREQRARKRRSSLATPAKQNLARPPRRRK